MNIKIDSKLLNENMVIWRYMDLSKLLDLLVTEELHFAQITEIQKIDPFDSSFVPFALSALEKHKIEVIPKKQMIESIRKQELKDRQNLYVNCWHNNTEESAALWAIYMKSNEGVAIRSTIKRLECAIKKRETNGNQTIEISPVSYGHREIIDTLEVHKPHSSGYGIFFPNGKKSTVLTKRSSFKHEEEIRALIDVSKHPDAYKYVGTDKTGVRVKVNLKALIWEIYVHPESPNWLAETVQTIVKKLNYDFEVIKSDLYSLE